MGLTRREIEALTPRAGRYDVPDEGRGAIPGLKLTILPSGKKTWSFRYSHVGRDLRVTLGSWPAMTLEIARERATEMSLAVQRREDPQSAIRARVAAEMTVAELLEKFGKDHVSGLKPKTQTEYKRIIKNQIMPALARVRLTQLGLTEIQDFRRSFGRHVRAANLALAILSKALSWSEEQGIRPPGWNPCKAVKRLPTRPKQRFLNGDEIARLLQALAEAALPPLPDAALRLLILTGARKGEILGLKWDDLDLAQSRAVLADHKTISRGDRLLYLPPEGVEILKSLPKHTSPYVFAGAGKHGTLGSTLDHAWLKVREMAGLSDVRIHDLRHTFASLAIAGGLTLEQAGQLLGHSSPATTKRYAHLVDEAARANVARVASAIAMTRD